VFLLLSKKNVFLLFGCSLSVSRARFVTAGAIDPKLCAYVPLGKSNSHTSQVQSDS
jgi:hypothetical protein